MSIHMTDMSEFLEARMTRGRAARVMFWNISVLDRTFSTWELVIGIGVAPMQGLYGLKYRTPRILRYDLDWGSLGEMSVLLRSSRPLKYFSIIERSLGEATSLVVMDIPLRDNLKQSTRTLDL